MDYLDYKEPPPPTFQSPIPNPPELYVINAMATRAVNQQLYECVAPQS
jgi:hypothetical protein